jgi:hypothetical protein
MGIKSLKLLTNGEDISHPLRGTHGEISNTMEDRHSGRDSVIVYHRKDKW